ncbi:hypothetical protein [Clostridium novyi]|nr:hypothetical protein [Clostridium novyi]
MAYFKLLICSRVHQATDHSYKFNDTITNIINFVLIEYLDSH